MCNAHMKNIRMQSRKLSLGLIVSFLLVVCQPQANAQFRRFSQRPQGGGSFSAVRSDAYEREVDLGPIEFSRGISRSGALTNQQGALSMTGSVAVNRGVNIAGFNIDSTLKRSQQRQNGQVSHGVAYDLDAGPLGFEASFDRQNLKNPLGLHRDADGGLDLNLGFLNLDFDHNNPRNNNDDVKTGTNVNAHGRNAFTRSGTNSNTNMRRVGIFDVTDSRSNSQGFAYAGRGQTSANTFGTVDGGDSQSQANSRGGFFKRGRRDTDQKEKLTVGKNVLGLLFDKEPAVASKLSMPTEKEEVINNVNKTADVESFHMVDGNKKQERTFAFLTNIFGSLGGGPQPNCVYPCTLEAFQQNNCCPPEYVPVPVPLPAQANNCYSCSSQPQYNPQSIQRPAQTQYPFYPQYSNNYYGNSFIGGYQQTQQCCAVCVQYNYYGPPPCSWRNSQFRPNYFLNNY